MPVTVEGPYGCFDFEDNHPRQIWVAGGIGITPFVARMKYLAHHPGERQPIDLFLPQMNTNRTRRTNLLPTPTQPVFAFTCTLRQEMVF